MLLAPTTLGRIATGIVAIFLAGCLGRIFLSLLPPLRPGLPAYVVELASARGTLLDGPRALADRHTAAEKMPVLQATPGGT